MVELVEDACGDIEFGIGLDQLLLLGSAFVGWGLEGIAKMLAFFLRELIDFVFEDFGDPFGGFFVAGCHQFIFFGFDLRTLFALGLGHERNQAGSGGLPRRRVPRGGENGTEAEIVVVGDWIVLMVVTLGAADCEAQQAGADNLQAVGHHLVGHDHLLAAGSSGIWPQTQQHGGR